MPVVFNKDITDINLEEICYIKNSVFYNIELDQFLHLHDDKELDEQLKKEFKEFLGENMRDLSKKEMIEALAEVMLTCEIDDHEDMELKDAISELDSDEIPDYVLREIEGKTENYEVKQESSRGSEGDGAEMFLTFYIKSLKEDAEGYLEFYGRYSSWDSSYFYDSYVVKPEEVMVIQYKRVK